VFQVSLVVEVSEVEVVVERPVVGLLVAELSERLVVVELSKGGLEVEQLVVVVVERLMAALSVEQLLVGERLMGQLLRLVQSGPSC